MWIRETSFGQLQKIDLGVDKEAFASHQGSIDRYGHVGGSLAACTRENHTDRPNDDLEVQPKAPIIDVSNIKRDVAVKRGILPSIHLPEPGDARGHV